MPLRRSKLLVKHIFENQHKFQSLVRNCSSSLRYKECEDAAQQSSQSTEHAAETTVVAKHTEKPILTPDISFNYDELQVRLAAPYQLQPKPDVVDLGFGKYFTDHMLKIYFHKQLGGWQKPEITPFENLTFHPAAKVLHYAIQLFEGFKVYRGRDDKLRIFRPELNMERMNLSAQRSGLPTFDGEALIQCMIRLIQIDQEWIPHSESSTLYVRPSLIGIDNTLGVLSPDSALLFVILSPVSSYYRADSDGSVSMYADPNVTRSFPGGVGNRKVGSNYGPTIEIQAQAAKLGHHQVLWLFGPDQQLTEVGAMNVFIVYLNEQGDKVLLTPPLNGLILPGVTRRSILELAQNWEDLEVKEEVVTMSQIIRLKDEGRLLEIFGAGTAVLISPISRIGYLDQTIHLPTIKQKHPIYKRIKDTLLAITYGHIEHPYVRVLS